MLDPFSIFLAISAIVMMFVIACYEISKWWDAFKKRYLGKKRCCPTCHYSWCDCCYRCVSCGEEASDENPYPLWRARE